MRTPPCQKMQRQTLVIEDGNACFHYVREIPQTFQGIAEKLFKSLNSKWDVIFSTDMYLPDSVKLAERRRRGYGEKLITSGPKTRRSQDWQNFLTNDEKRQLAEILLTSWSSDDFSGALKDRSVVIVVDGWAYELTADGSRTPTGEIVTLRSSQETDTHTVLYCLYAQEARYKYARVCSPDNDIFFILLYHARQFQNITVLFETGKDNKRRCLDMNELAKSLSPTMCSSLLSLHAFIGCDSASAFKGKGKVNPIKLPQKSQNHQETFSEIGKACEISSTVQESVPCMAIL